MWGVGLGSRLTEPPGQPALHGPPPLHVHQHAPTVDFLTVRVFIRRCKRGVTRSLRPVRCRRGLSYCPTSPDLTCQHRSANTDHTYTYWTYARRRPTYCCEGLTRLGCRRCRPRLNFYIRTYKLTRVSDWRGLCFVFKDRKERRYLPHHTYQAMPGYGRA